MITTGILSGCAYQQASATARPPIASPITVDGVHPVPPAAPNYYPDSMFRALGTVRRDSTAPIRMVRSIVKVAFRDGTAQRARQQAIDSIGGVVVGGYLLDADGEYYIRIPGPTYEDIQTAVSKLRVLPQVEFAFPMLLSTGHICCGEVRTGRSVQ